MTSARDEILGRLRRARSRTPPESASGAAVSFEAVFAPLKEEDLLSSFERSFAALAGELHVVPDAKSATQTLSRVLADVPATQVLWQPSARLLRLRPASGQAVPVADEALLASPARVARYRAGVTLVAALIARTGSLVVSAGAGGRLISVLPEVHVAVAWASQLWPSVADWLRGPGAEEHGSMTSVTSGPSRTADIEKQLVLGAHGPKRLVLCVIDDRRSP